MRNVALIILNISFIICVDSQNEYSKWNFGNNAALDFMTNPPTRLNSSSMNAYGGCSRIADASGNLLFYTDGAAIWNKQNAIMANGTMSIAGSYPAPHPLIVKQPGNQNLYYVFTVFPSPLVVTLPVPPPIITNGLYYSVVDMSLAGGLGSVTVNHQPIYTVSPPNYWSTTSQIHATRHANGVDYWIMIHSYGNTSFGAYLLSSAGINPIPVVSSVGLQYWSGSHGYLKFSPSGQRLSVSVRRVGVEIYDFDNSTGLVTNPLTLLSDQLEENFRGCEFSPDGTKLYAGHNIIGSPLSKIIQWDLNAGNAAAVVSSSVNIPSSFDPYALQLAPDGKIYITSNNSQSLSVINNPNGAGLSCNLVVSGQFVSAAINPTLNSFSRTGLPNMITHITNTPCISQVISNPQSFCKGNSYSIGNKTYTSIGTYIDTIQNVFGCNGIVVVSTQVDVKELPKISFSFDSLICINESLKITASGASSYTWNSGTNGNQFTSPQFTNTGAYSFSVQIQGSGNNGCVSKETLGISVLVDACDVSVMKDGRRGWQVELFPNPANDNLIVKSETESEELNISIHDMTGMEVLTTLILTDNHSGTIALRLMEGAYVTTITNSKGQVLNKKLLITK